ncbi:MAG TPA: hypothetical protein VFV03_04005 [Solirubrobacteraceae bacterium]|nr:hypothetical protein [Solirubrobacteraceae bacterium]
MPGAVLAPSPDPSEDEPSDEDSFEEDVLLPPDSLAGEFDVLDVEKAALAFRAGVGKELPAAALSAGCVELALALAEPTLDRAASAARARWTIVELPASDAAGAGPSELPTTIPPASTTAASTPVTRRDGAPGPSHDAALAPGENGAFPSKASEGS